MTAKYLGTHDFSGASIFGGGRAGVTVAGSGTSDCPSPDYPTVRAALVAGHRNIIVVGDTLEAGVGNVTVSASGGTITLTNNATIDLSSHRLGVSNESLIIQGLGTITGTDVGLITGSQIPGNILLVDGVTIDSSGCGDTAINITPSERVEVRNSRVILPAADHGFDVNDNTTISHCIFNGAGGDTGIKANSPVTWSRVTDVVFEGTWGSPRQFILGNVVGLDMLINGVRFNVDPNESLQLVLGSYMQISNLSRLDGDISFQANDELINCQLLNCVADFGPMPATRTITNFTFSNCIGSGTNSLISSLPGSARNRWVNCVIGDITVGSGTGSTPNIHGQDNLFSNTTFYQNVTINGSGNLFSNCRFEGNLIVLSEAFGTIISDCICDGDFTDNGTDTQATVF